MSGGEATIRRAQPWLGTFVEITAPSAFAEAVDTAFGAIRLVHNRMSFHLETSDLAALRRARTGARVAVAPATVQVLLEARRLHAASGGIFDVTVGHQLVANGHLPRPAGFASAAATGTMAEIEILSPTSVRCHAPLLIDLGGIAKGFAVNLAIQTLLEAGAASAIVNAGGDLRVIGKAPVWIKTEDGLSPSTIELHDMAMATSASPRDPSANDPGGSPHRDGRTGAGVTGCVSVIAPSCMLADALTKVALVDAHLAEHLATAQGGALLRLPDAIAA